MLLTENLQVFWTGQAAGWVENTKNLNESCTTHRSFTKFHIILWEHGNSTRKGKFHGLVQNSTAYENCASYSLLTTNQFLPIYTQVITVQAETM